MTAILMTIVRVFLILVAFYAIRNAFVAAEHRHTPKTIIWCTMILVCTTGLAITV